MRCRQRETKETVGKSRYAERETEQDRVKEKRGG